jgi:hypothetical protein
MELKNSATLSALAERNRPWLNNRPPRSRAMSFQAYLDTIQAKTGLDADALKAAADTAGLSDGGRLRPAVKAGQVADWGKGTLGLGHGHAMAIYALLSGKRGPGD